MNRHRRSAVALRHVAFEDLGLLSAVLDRAGWDVAFCDAAIDDVSHPSIENADLLIVLGGPIGVYEAEAYPFLTREIQLLEHRLNQDRPTLGICLGAQLMARALGARVYAGRIKEIGWGQISLTEQGAASCLAPLAEDNAAVLHWHGDTFDLPDGAMRLASTCITRTKHLPMAAMHWRCNSISRPIRGSWRNGISATPSNYRKPAFL